MQALFLWRCTLAQPSLVAAIGACSPLKRLTVVWAGYTVTGSKLGKVCPRIDLEELGNILRAKHRGLEHLRLDPRECWASGIQYRTAIVSLAKLLSRRSWRYPTSRLWAGQITIPARGSEVLSAPSLSTSCLLHCVISSSYVNVCSPIETTA